MLRAGRPERRHLLAPYKISRPEGAERLTIHTTRTVRPEHEAAFEAALREFVTSSLQIPGQIGVYVLCPPLASPARQYNILRQFCDEDARDAFYNSPIFRNWLHLVEPLTASEPQHEERSGLELWFTLPNQGEVVPPPRWKVALVTLCAVYPASLFIPWLLHWFNGEWPLFLRVLLNCIAIVGLLTWLVMPFLTRLLRSWLYGPSSAKF